jgi:hypothetical protein
MFEILTFRDHHFWTFRDWFRRIGTRQRGLRDGFLHSPSPSLLHSTRSAVLSYCASRYCCLCICVRGSHGARTSGTSLLFCRPSGVTLFMLFMLLIVFCIFVQNHIKASRTQQMVIPALIQQHVSAWQTIISLTKNIRVCTQLYGNWDLHILQFILLYCVYIYIYICVCVFVCVCVCVCVYKT